MILSCSSSFITHELICSFCLSFYFTTIFNTVSWDSYYSSTLINCNISSTCYCPCRTLFISSNFCFLTIRFFDIFNSQRVSISVRSYCHRTIFIGSNCWRCSTLTNCLSTFVTSITISKVRFRYNICSNTSSSCF